LRAGADGDAQKQSFSVVEATIPAMQKAMQQKRVTSRELVVQYLTRIGLYENKLRGDYGQSECDQEAEGRSRTRARQVRGRCTGFQSR
jgi:hypothetical protein